MVAADQLPSYLDEFMWRERFANSTNDVFDNAIAHPADIYPNLATFITQPLLKVQKTNTYRYATLVAFEMHLLFCSVLSGQGP